MLGMMGCELQLPVFERQIDGTVRASLCIEAVLGGASLGGVEGGGWGVVTHRVVSQGSSK